MKRFFYYTIITLVFYGNVYAYRYPYPFLPAGSCGNPSSKGPASPPPTYPNPPVPTPGDPFNPFTGNEHRVVSDLQIWNTVGEIPMVWKRYYNSREFRGFSHSFIYTMADAGTNSQGQPQVFISMPDGSELIFAQSASDASRWLPFSGVPERLFQQGNDFFLQEPSGHRYRFRRTVNPEGSFYQLRDFRDSKQNLYTLAFNGDGSVSKVTEPGGRFFQLTYINLSGQQMISKVSTSDGRSVQYNYNVYNDGVVTWPLLVSASYGDGTQASYSYYPPHYGAGGFMYLEHAIDPRYDGVNVNMRFTYDTTVARGYIKEEINGKTGHVMTTLTTSGSDRWVCYPYGRVQHYVMPNDQLGKTTEFTDGLGRTTQYTFDAYGFIASLTDPRGKTTLFTRTMYGNLLQVTYPDGSTQKWTRDDLDRELSYTDELNRVTTYTRDALHRITKITYPDGTHESFTFNNFGQVLTHTRKSGGVESYAYNSAGLKTSFTNALGNTTSYAYHATGQLSAETDARGLATLHTYNERGLLTKKTFADNSFMLYAYDGFGNPTAVTNEIGNTWNWQFDEFKRVVSVSDPLNRATLYSYDLPGGVSGATYPYGYPSAITSPAGRVTRTEYDAEWQAIKKITGAGTAEAATNVMEYDAAGNLTRRIDPRQGNTVFTYTERNRMKTVTDAAGNTFGLTYDLTGNVLAISRPGNNTYSMTYDNMNRRVQITDPKGQVTLLAYDADGNMTRLTDPRSFSYDMQYDLLRRTTKMIYPGGSFEDFAYDAVGNMTAYKNRSGALRTYSYDNRNRRTASNWNDNTPDITTSYDAAGRVLTLVNGISQLNYSYNSANELTGETQNITGAAGSRQLSFTYDADGLRSGLVYPGGALALAYTHTARRQLASISANGDNLASYGYDLSGNKVAEFRKNAAGTSYAYDEVDRVLNITHQKGGVSFANFEYGYDNLYRRTHVRRDYNKGDVYAYDAIDQVTGVQYEASNPNSTPSNPLRTVSYNYDASGNRIQVNDNGLPANYTSNDLSQYTAVNGNPVTHDVNGNLQTIDGWTYTYDAQNRLVQATKGLNTLSFEYDARNRCVKRTINGVSSFLYYDDWNLVQEEDAGGNAVAQYIQGTKIDELLARNNANGMLFYHADGLGSTTQLTDAAGKVVEQYAYDVFGTPVIKDSLGAVIPASAFDNRFMFTGREFIKETGNYDYRNRMYSAALGRFMQTDPLRFGGGDFNLYRYVGNNAINFTDPTGEIGPLAIALIGAAAGAGIAWGLDRLWDWYNDEPPPPPTPTPPPPTINIYINNGTINNNYYNNPPTP